MFYTLIDDNKDLDIGISLIQRPNIPVPERQYRVISREGASDVYEDLGYYSDIEIPLEYNFVSDDYMNAFRRIKHFFKKGKILRFSDDLGGFYKIKKIVIQNNIREIIEFGNFTILVTCDPYFYLDEGQEYIELYKGIMIENIYEETFPIFKVYGNGSVTINVNDKCFRVNVGQELTIDSKLELSYRESGVISNTSLKGLYKDLKLKEGINTINWDGDFKIELIPNWRCL